MDLKPEYVRKQDLTPSPVEPGHGVEAERQPRTEGNNKKERPRGCAVAEVRWAF